MFQYRTLVTLARRRTCLYEQRNSRAEAAERSAGLRGVALVGNSRGREPSLLTASFASEAWVEQRGPRMEGDGHRESMKT